MTKDQKSLVENIVNSDRIFLMMKGTPEMPRCGFSSRVVQVLNSLEITTYGSLNVFDDFNMMNMIKEYSKTNGYKMYALIEELIKERCTKKILYSNQT